MHGMTASGAAASRKKVLKKKLSVLVGNEFMANKKKVMAD